jgi:hypothetical protein
MPGSIAHDHRDCLAHGPICLRPPVARKYLGRFGGNVETLRQWAQTVCDRWQARVEAGERPPFGDDFAFWGAEYDAAFGHMAKAISAGPQVPGVEETKAYLATLRSAAK